MPEKKSRKRKEKKGKRVTVKTSEDAGDRQRQSIKRWRGRRGSALLASPAHQQLRPHDDAAHERCDQPPHAWKRRGDQPGESNGCHAEVHRLPGSGLPCRKGGAQYRGSRHTSIPKHRRSRHTIRKLRQTLTRTRAQARCRRTLHQGIRMRGRRQTRR